MFSEKKTLNCFTLNYKMQDAINKLYKHAVLNKNSKPLNEDELRELIKQLKIEAMVLTWPEYKKLAEMNKEPENAIIWLGIPGEMGHWVGAFTDNQNVIIYEDSFGLVPPSKIRGRRIKVSNSCVQDTRNSNCGYLALLFIATHNKVNSLFPSRK